MSPAEFIAAHLPVATVPGLPIRLHGAKPQSGVWRLAGDGAAPYWAWAWPGGVALAQHLLSVPQSLAGRRALDLGTGSGLVAIAAKLAGAAKIVACDIDPNALVAARLNAALNETEIDFLESDPLDGPVPDTDIILIGDFFYAADLAARVCAFLDRCHAHGVEILIGDIGRPALPRHRLVQMSSWPVADFGDSGKTPRRTAGVYRFTHNNHRPRPLHSSP